MTLTSHCQIGIEQHRRPDADVVPERALDVVNPCHELTVTVSDTSVIGVTAEGAAFGGDQPLLFNLFSEVAASQSFENLLFREQIVQFIFRYCDVRSL